MRSGIVQPNLYDYKDPNPYWVYGDALVSRGLFNRYATNGVGLVTDGLVWELYDIYHDVDWMSKTITTWANAFPGTTIVTTWTPAIGSSIAPTVWAGVTFSHWGDNVL